MSKVPGNHSGNEGMHPAITIHLVGDSTMADYSADFTTDTTYMKGVYPLTGWGQVFKEYSNLKDFANGHKRVNVTNHAKAGGSTRTFLREGRWSTVYEGLKNEDLVLIQFGHNDSAENKPERFVTIDRYVELLTLFVNQTKEKRAIPILVTPVCRNYPWKEGRLQNAHGEYPQAVKNVARDNQVLLIDLNEISMKLFSEEGEDYVTSQYFMNLPAGKFEAYPDGLNDNTHFQTAGASVVANLVVETMKVILGYSSPVKVAGNKY